MTGTATTDPLAHTDGAYDVAVVGGGPAGCSAGVFTARYGLSTVVFDRGSSSLRRCAYLENFLGFPAGVDIDLFYELAHDHVREAGGVLVDDLVESVERDGDGFRLSTQDGRTVRADVVVAATKYDGDYLRPLGEPSMFETADPEAGGSGERFDRSYPNDDGSTPVEGLYVAGPLSGCGDQAIIAAGHGATVGRTVVGSYRSAAGYWGTFAERYDWLRQAAELDGEWGDRDRWREWFDEAAPADLDDDRRRRLREQHIDDRLAAYVDDETVAERRARGHRELAARLDPDAVLDALSDERIRAYAASLDDSDVSEE